MEKLHCPYCNNELIQGEDQKFETLSDHVSDPNREDYPKRRTWICDNHECPVSLDSEAFWDDSGDFYGWPKGYKFKDDLDSAYPSIARQLDIEIYKKGLKSQKLLSPAFMLWILQPMIEYNYEANESGEVTKKWIKIKWLKKDCWYKKDRFGYHISYSFPLVNIYQSLKLAYQILYKPGFSEGYKNQEIQNMFEPLARWDKRWWRHATKFLYKVLFYKKYLKFKKDNDGVK